MRIRSALVFESRVLIGHPIFLHLGEYHQSLKIIIPYALCSSITSSVVCFKNCCCVFVCYFSNTILNSQCIMHVCPFVRRETHQKSKISLHLQSLISALSRCPWVLNALFCFHSIPLNSALYVCIVSTVDHTPVASTLFLLAPDHSYNKTSRITKREYHIKQ